MIAMKKTNLAVAKTAPNRPVNPRRAARTAASKNRSAHANMTVFPQSPGDTTEGVPEGCRAGGAPAKGLTVRGAEATVRVRDERLEDSMDVTREAADARFAASGGDRSVVPAGWYCYTWNEGTTPPSTVPCPYWARVPEQEHQEDGYCALVGKGDWESGHFGLLWDQVKECDVNPRFPGEDDGFEDEEAAAS
jgi:hypothetical protein